MPVLLAFAATEREARAVGSASTALARTLELDVERSPLPSTDAVDHILHAVDGPETALVALPYTAGHAARLVGRIIQRCAKPVLVVPTGRGTRAATSIDRVLVPLDGTETAADTVATTVGMFCAAGVDVVVLHVFDAATLPKFWDHAEHARQSWAREFLARYCSEPAARLELRSGAAGQNVLEVAAAEHADLIVLGWSQNLSAGHAGTVRTTLARTTNPVLLLPVAPTRNAG